MVYGYSSLSWITFVSTRDEKHAVTEWCPACRIPLCAMCKVRVKKRPIPAALGNDNLLGCPPASLYAVASPVYTACVSFYLENDFGHLPEQELHSAKNAVAVRGTINALGRHHRSGLGECRNEILQTKRTLKGSLI